MKTKTKTKEIVEKFCHICGNKLDKSWTTPPFWWCRNCKRPRRNIET